MKGNINKNGTIPSTHVVKQLLKLCLEARPGDTSLNPAPLEAEVGRLQAQG